MKIYDSIIIGGGPAGYTAGIYNARAGFKTLLIEKFSAGGQMTETDKIDNYPGFEDGIDGFTLGFKMEAAAKKFGTEVLQDEVLSVDFSDKIKSVTVSDKTIFSKTVIIATGAHHKKLGILNEENLIGKGVGYCATCDGMFYKGKTVAVIGGGNSAVKDASFLSNICEKVILIHRRDTFRASKIDVESLKKAKNVEFKLGFVLSELLFDNKINGIKIKNVKTEETEEIALSGVFISIGRSPETNLFKGKLSLDENGYIIADETTKTNVSGVFAVGDVRTKPLRQIVTATADGAVSSHFIEEILKDF